MAPAPTGKMIEMQQQLLDEKLIKPRKRFTDYEKSLIRKAEEAGMSGALPKDGKKQVAKAPKAASTTAAPAIVTTAAAGAGRKTAPKTAAKATTKAAVTTKTTAGKKRKSDDDEEKPPVKKARAAPKGSSKAKVVINEAPTQKLNVYVFGEGSSGELGLGSVGPVIDVKRPRINPNLSATKVGVVQIAVGGMHAAALTHDGKILTWGVNDQGALGRDTTYDGNMRDIDDEGSDEGEDSGINPREATPTEIDMTGVPEGTVFTQVAAGDSATFAVTDDGLVYGCGTFRSNEGILGFSKELHIQATFALVAGLKKITSVACGDNHVLALNNRGAVFAWGSGQQNQLGRRVVERTRMNGLTPREFGLPKNKITYVSCGAYHSFAIDNAGSVWSWGLNSYGETGVADGAGEDEAVVLKPRVIDSLEGKGVVRLAGGAHHSIAVTEGGECLVWGRVDGCQSGLKVANLPEDDIIRDKKGAARILVAPTAIDGAGEAAHAAAGTDTSIMVNKAGRAFSWGFSGNYQTGLGTTEDVEVATLIDNTAVREKKLVWAGAGGQFGMVASVAEDEEA